MTETRPAVSPRTLRVGPRPALSVDVAGERGAPLILFLHGIGGRRLNWTRQLRQFGGQYLAAAADHRGYGDSDDYEGPLAMADLSGDTLRLIDHFGAAQAHLVGLSLGGRIALDLWKRAPERVRSLTLADTSAGSKESQDPARIEAFLAARRAPLLAGRTPAELAPELAQQIAGPFIGDAERRELIESLAALHPASYVKTLEMATRFTDFPDFATIDVPTLVVVGSEDKVAPPPIARAMAAAIPGARLEVIDGAGHISNLERPAEFNACLSDFLDSLR